MIGKLDGYAGPQTHDYEAMIKAGQQEWVDFVRPLIDEDRMFSADDPRFDFEFEDDAFD